jgi:hypothetical protein
MAVVCSSGCLASFVSSTTTVDGGSVRGLETSGVSLSTGASCCM